MTDDARTGFATANVTPLTSDEAAGLSAFVEQPRWQAPGVMWLNGPVVHFHDGPAEGLVLDVPSGTHTVIVPTTHGDVRYHRVDGVCVHGRPVFLPEPS